MEAAADLFVEECVLHRLQHERIDTDSEFAEIPCAFVCVQKGIDPVVVVCCCFDDPAVLDLKDDVLIRKAHLL